MDTRTRGAIEKLMDDFMQRVNISSDVRWIGNEYPIKSIADVALGLAIGAIETLTVDEIFRLENRIANDADLSEMREILKRRLSEIISKIKFELNI